MSEHINIIMLPLLCFIRAYGLKKMYKYKIGGSFPE